MESAMANVDLGRYRRIVQMFWDPAPTNDPDLDLPVWCLGSSYKLGDGRPLPPAKAALAPTDTITSNDTAATRTAPTGTSATTSSTNTAHSPDSPQLLNPASHKRPVPGLPENAPATPPESTSSSFSSSLAYDDNGQDHEPDSGWPPGFMADFESKFWMTYRSEFEPIPRSSDPKATSALSLSMRIKSQLVDQTGFSSDSGWGCMIRSGQSLLANTIAMLRLGRDWRRGELQTDERQIISMFADDPQAPYSIHNFVRHGATACGKYPGEWFGPLATARCIQALTNNRETSLRVYTTGDGPDVYEDSFLKIAQPDGEEFHPTMILVSTRLGIDKITPVYWQALIASLQMRQSIGIAGGRPSSSHYFIGAQGDFLFYLDPHQTRKALPYRADPARYTDEEIDSCHTTRLRRIHVREMDPSMLIGFLIRSKEDWLEWRSCVKHVQGKAIIHVADRDPMRLGAAEGREGAIDEVEPLSDDDTDTILDG